ncbi:hypothetical protein SBF1_1910003 [Candidatus Desulfosporosinus infrequens]|uniref:Uncharacterized protein n=1 Tax=Candidatus Desulfosporosinus infrequens TaxID=2043169 RepID=A0A2U3KG19_9FIRM|nr:hypothetical protein SBF1_1910003 [Candidatus Desulfosporosinus infrequens]
MNNQNAVLLQVSKQGTYCLSTGTIHQRRALKYDENFTNSSQPCHILFL